MKTVSLTLTGELNTRMAAAHLPKEEPSNGKSLQFDAKGVGTVELSPGDWVITWLVTTPVKNTSYEVTVEGGDKGKVGPTKLQTIGRVGPGNVMITVAQ